MFRGIGRRLEVDSHMYTACSRSGARIEHIEREVDKLEDREDRHLGLLVGTNNIKYEASEVVVDKYRQLIAKLKTKRNRAVTLVGIPTRYNISAGVDSRRVGMNRRLRELCSKECIKYVEHQCSRSRLGRDGLHLNGI